LQTVFPSCIFLVLLSVIFAVLTVKTICDLKEENLRLWQQLALERQKVIRSLSSQTLLTGGNLLARMTARHLTPAMRCPGLGVEAGGARQHPLHQVVLTLGPGPTWS
jgi:hypothetical protein